MGQLHQKLRVLGDAAEREVEALLDSNAGASLIRRDIAESICRVFATRSTPLVFRFRGGEELRSSRSCGPDLLMKGKWLDGHFYVVDGLPCEMIVGRAFMQQWEIHLDLKREDYSVGVDPDAMEI